MLRGYKVPGSRFRRIPVEEAKKFAAAHGIPINSERKLANK